MLLWAGLELPVLSASRFEENQEGKKERLHKMEKGIKEGERHFLQQPQQVFSESVMVSFVQM